MKLGFEVNVKTNAEQYHEYQHRTLAKLLRLLRHADNSTLEKCLTLLLLLLLKMMMMMMSAAIVSRDLRSHESDKEQLKSSAASPVSRLENQYPAG
jgi:hypothetical protein